MDANFEQQVIARFALADFQQIGYSFIIGITSARKPSEQRQATC